MTKQKRNCLTCKKKPLIFEDLEDDTENIVPLWYKKIGNYSLLPPFFNCSDEYNMVSLLEKKKVADHKH